MSYLTLLPLWDTFKLMQNCTHTKHKLHTFLNSSKPVSKFKICDPELPFHKASLGSSNCALSSQMWLSHFSLNFLEFHEPFDMYFHM